MAAILFSLDTPVLLSVFRISGPPGAGNKSKSHPSVPARFYEDPILGMGLDHKIVRSRYNVDEDVPSSLQVGLDERLGILTDKMRDAKSTTDTYIRISNFFLVSHVSVILVPTSVSGSCG